MAQSLGANAATIPDEDVSVVRRSPLEPRQSLCCALAQNNVKIQIVCQYMYETCGGWSNCLRGQPNDQQWCHYCVVSHPEDAACLKLTWPPVDPAPISKRNVEELTILPPPKPKDPKELQKTEEAKKTKENAKGNNKKLHARATQFVDTRALVNQAQSYSRVLGLVTVRIVVSALNVVTYSIQNAGPREIVFEIVDMATRWFVNGNIDSGEVSGGHAPADRAQGGHRFEIIVD
ncbi:hypothetical protein IL306_006284 [Fusarium sp. DS 682]|nr:hypothetical protein IL306_006284 [Fusarium sp. DS 682]